MSQGVVVFGVVICYGEATVCVTEGRTKGVHTCAVKDQRQSLKCSITSSVSFHLIKLSNLIQFPFLIQLPIEAIYWHKVNEFCLVTIQQPTSGYTAITYLGEGHFQG